MSRAARSCAARSVGELRAVRRSGRSAPSGGGRWSKRPKAVTGMSRRPIMSIFGPAFGWHHTRAEGCRRAGAEAGCGGSEGLHFGGAAAQDVVHRGESVCRGWVRT
eukprot:scaffold19428_cov63-Phaeocystis_antarctica.AAC.10